MKVIVALDQTDCANQIIDAVLNRRWAKDTCFKLITILEPHQWEEADWHKWRKLAEQVHSDREKAAESFLQKARLKIQESVPDSSVHIEIKQGSAKTELLKSATEWMADKIIVGAHGYQPNRLFGSLPQALSRQAPCSIELVRLQRKLPCELSPRTSKEKVRAST